MTPIRLFTFVCLSAVVLLTYTSSRQLTYAEPPDDTPDSSLTSDAIAALQRAYGQHDGVILQQDYSIEHSGGKEANAIFRNEESRWTYSVAIRTQTVIFNTDNPYLTSFEVAAPPYEALIVIRRPDGTLSRYTETDLTAEPAGAGDSVYTLVYPNVTAGTIVDESYQMKYRFGFFPPPRREDIPLWHGLPCRRLTATIAFPDWWQVQVKQTLPDTALPLKVQRYPDDGTTVIVYTAEDIEPLPDEPFGPHPRELGQYFKYQAVEGEMNGYSWSFSKSWDEWAKKFRESLLEHDGRDYSDLRDSVSNLIEGAASDRARLDSILAFVHRSVSITNQIRFCDYEELLKAGTGSGVDITGLTRKMCALAGLEAEFLCLHSAEQGYFDTGFVASTELDVPGLRVKVDTAALLVIPWLTYIPAGFIPSYLADQPALVLQPTGSPEFTRIAAPSHEQSTVVTRVTADLTENGTVTVTREQLLTGAAAVGIRVDLAGANETEISRYLKNRLGVSSATASLVEWNIQNLHSMAEPLSITTVTSLEGALVKSGSSGYLKTESFANAAWLNLPSAEQGRRIGPIRLYQNQAFEWQIIINYPRTWRLDETPSGDSVCNAFGSATVVTKSRPGRLTVEGSLLLNRTAQPNDRWAQLLALIGPESPSYLRRLTFQTATE